MPRILRSATVILLVLSVLISCISCSGSDEDQGSQVPKTPDELYGYNYRINTTEYVQCFACGGEKYMLLVNKTNPLGQNYTPDQLVSLDTTLTNLGKEIQLEANTAKAAEAMILEMRARGYDGISITSGYRSYDYQSVLFSTYTQNEMKNKPKLTKAEAEEIVLTYSAKPGTSEHQSGLCVDLFNSTMTSLVNYGYETNAQGDLGFAETGAYRWLLENAQYFGFVLRFPETKESVTGYSFESWHFRFVGVENAKKITAAGLTLEEYIG